jgi:hypothetical protein
MKQTLTMLLVLCLTVYLFFLAGCARERKPGTDARTDMAIIKSALKEAGRAADPEMQIKYLRTAYHMADRLEESWPDNNKVPSFLADRQTDLKSIPQQVYKLSMETGDLNSFKWAITNSPTMDIQYTDLQRAYHLGKEWRDYFISEHPGRARPIFMDEAVKYRDTRFFDQHIGEFEAGGYRLVFPLNKNEFMAQLSGFMAEMLEKAMQAEDVIRIRFLLDHMPEYDPRIHTDPITLKSMRNVSDYVFHDLKDEAMACRLIELRYDMVRIDVDQTGFGNDFAEALLADLDYAVHHVLKLDEWHGPLSQKEMSFVLSLPEPLLRSIHKLHLLEAMEGALLNKKNDDLARLIRIREEIKPLTLREYDRLLGWSVKYRNTAVYNYILKKLPPVDLYNISLAELGSTPNVFRMHAPKIFRNIEPTLDKRPRSNGTTLGRIDDLLRSRNPEAVLYVVQKYDLNSIWRKVPTEGRTLLMAVCEGGNLEAATYLIEKKYADIHAKTDFSKIGTTLLGRGRPEEGGFKPIHFAAMSGNSKLIEYLQSRGADVNAKSVLGTTPLMIAVSEQHLEAAQTLLALGADVNAQMDRQLTGTDLAEYGGIESLRTAYRRAMTTGNRKILDLLRKSGAMP